LQHDGFTCGQNQRRGIPPGEIPRDHKNAARKEKTMSDTPETDFHCWTDNSEELLIAVCHADFCRKLERERNEARYLLKHAQSALDAIHLEIGGWIKTMSVTSK
jgi:hypothetical protein